MSLDNAIDLLIRTACRENTDKYSPAIRILKAAEKVDKGISIELMDELRFFLVEKDERDEDYIKTWTQIKSLFESLPDPEPK